MTKAAAYLIKGLGWPKLEFQAIRRLIFSAEALICGMSLRILEKAE